MENLLNKIRLGRSHTKADLLQPGRLPGLKPIAIVDIGSNSVRLVVYEGLIRTPTQLFNEKEMLELGQIVAQTGAIDETSIEETCRVLKRFRQLCKEMKVASVLPIATAAARDAKNADDFLKRASKALGTPIEVISGEEEARLAALGVISGFHSACGVVGDMGGGSLELLAVDKDKADKGLTLPLGALTLKNLAKGDVKAARKIALEHCAKLDVLKAGKAKPFFAVGGTWRSIAHLHMQYINYPLSVVHDYRVQAADMLEFLKQLQKPEEESDVKLSSISSRRRALIPYGAAVMEAVLEVSKASEVVFSANGVREGLLYDRLSAEERSEDPLIAAARDLGYLRSRSPLYAHEVFLWCSQIFQHQSVAETADERRLRQAACYLSDIGWRAHPDYRGEQSFSTLLNAALSGTDHQGRGYLALVNLLRYAGSGTATPENIAPLLNDRATNLARLLAASMRVAYVISASMPGVLGKTAMTIDDTSLTLIIGRNQKDLQSRRLDSRLATLAKLMDREAVVKVRLI